MIRFRKLISLQLKGEQTLQIATIQYVLGFRQNTVRVLKKLRFKVYPLGYAFR